MIPPYNLDPDQGMSLIQTFVSKSRINADTCVRVKKALRIQMEQGRQDVAFIAVK